MRFVAVLLMTSIGFYTMFIYAASYLTERMHVSTARALDMPRSNLYKKIERYALTRES